jgi:hypothetical protein
MRLWLMGLLTVALAVPAQAGTYACLRSRDRPVRFEFDSGTLRTQLVRGGR